MNPEDLFDAIKKTDIEKINLYIQEKNNLNIVNSVKCSALCASSKNSDIRPLKLLLQAGANPNGQPGQKYTPLIWAISLKHTEHVKLLLEYNVKVHFSTSTTRKPIEVAVYNRNPVVIDMILDIAKQDIKECFKFRKEIVLAKEDFLNKEQKTHMIKKIDSFIRKIKLTNKLDKVLIYETRNISSKRRKI